MCVLVSQGAAQWEASHSVTAMCALFTFTINLSVYVLQELSGPKPLTSGHNVCHNKLMGSEYIDYCTVVTPSFNMRVALTGEPYAARVCLFILCQSVKHSSVTDLFGTFFW